MRKHSVRVPITKAFFNSTSVPDKYYTFKAIKG